MGSEVAGHFVGFLSCDYHNYHKSAERVLARSGSSHLGASYSALLARMSPSLSEQPAMSTLSPLFFDITSYGHRNSDLANTSDTHHTEPIADFTFLDLFLTPKHRYMTPTLQALSATDRTVYETLDSLQQTEVQDWLGRLGTLRRR